MKVRIGMALVALLAGCGTEELKSLVGAAKPEPEKITAQTLVGAWEDDPHGDRWRVMVLYESGAVSRRERGWDGAQVTAVGRWELRGEELVTKIEIPQRKGGTQPSGHNQTVTQLQDGKLPFEGRMLVRLSAQPKQLTDAQREEERRAKEARLATLRDTLATLEQRVPTRRDGSSVVHKHDRALRDAQREAAFLDDGGLLVRALNISFADEDVDYCDAMSGAIFAAMTRGAMSSLESLISNGATDCEAVVAQAVAEARAIGHTQAAERLWRATFPKITMPAQLLPGSAPPSTESAEAARAEGELPTTMRKPIVPAEDPAARKARGIAALHKAAQSGDLLMTKAWLEQGIGAEELDPGDPQKRSALRLAVEGGHKDVIKLLIARGADARAKDANGQSVLAVAQDRRPELVPLLGGTAP